MFVYALKSGTENENILQNWQFGWKWPQTCDTDCAPPGCCRERANTEQQGTERSHWRDFAERVSLELTLRQQTHLSINAWTKRLKEILLSSEMQIIISMVLLRESRWLLSASLTHDWNSGHTAHSFILKHSCCACCAEKTLATISTCRIAVRQRTELQFSFQPQGVSVS